MCKKRLDTYAKFPSGMEDYLGYNGWHFNKRMCEWAVSLMKGRDGNKVTPMTKEHVDAMMARQGVSLPDSIGYDYVYVANMAKSDFFGSSIPDESRMAKFVKDYINDPDGYDEVAFTRFYADCIGKGEVIPWEDVL